jgi:hypothetical protein
MNDNLEAPASKRDLRDLESRLDGKLDALEQRMEGKMDAQEQRILDNVRVLIEGAETRLLNAFYSYSKSNDRRVFEVEANEATLRSRVAIIENRLTDIEQRLNMPPQQ